MSRAWVAAPEEAGEVARLLIAFRDHLGYPWPPDAVFHAGVRRLMGEDAVYVLAGDPPAGVVQLRFRHGLWRDGGDCLVEDVFVDAAARGQGLARSMLELATQVARDRGCTRMDLDVNEDNAAALALYASFGFVRTAGPGRDLYLRRHLTPGGAA